MRTNPFDAAPLQEALEAAADAARASLRESAFGEVDGLVVIAETHIGGEPIHAAAGFPHDALSAHADLCYEAQHVFLQASGMAPPVLKVLMDALRLRGWEVADVGVMVDPEGNRYGNVVAALEAQTFREIAQDGGMETA